MREIDKTKKTLDVKNMDESTKREMFDKFKKIGGVAYQDRASNKTGTIKRTHKPQNNSLASYSSSPAIGKSGDINDKRNQFVEFDKKQTSSFFNRLAVKFKAKFGGVANFDGNISLKFANQVNTELSRYLFNLKLLQRDITPQAFAALKKEFNLYQFLLRQVFSLYDSEDFQQIQRCLHIAYGSSVSPRDLQGPFYRIFKKLYLLYSYQKTISKILDVINNNLASKKSSSLYKDIKQEFNLIYSYFFEKLYLFVISCEKKNIPIISLLMEDILEITEEDKSIDLEDSSNKDFLNDDVEEEGENDDVEEEEDDENEISDNMYLSKGLELIAATDIQNKKAKFLTQRDIDNLDDTDKNHLIYITFKEFDMEYSPILTTGQIKINQKLKSSNKNMTYQDSMQSIYDSVLNVSKRIEMYNQLKNDYEAFKNDKPANYIIAAKKQTELSNKLENSGLEFRTEIKTILKEIIELFSRMIKELDSQNEQDENEDDHSQENRIILNPTESLNNELNQSPLFEEKTVKEAIIQTYCYCLAFLHKIDNSKF